MKSNYQKLTMITCLLAGAERPSVLFINNNVNN